ncbi:MAG: cbb3-type cytochrome c oxidase subunit 3 [Candidatus Competibacterales bacterium]|nr:cbb3-type cytochrome c oxidase subunit 3 [Candidatus Competibacterales bacterium]
MVLFHSWFTVVLLVIFVGIVLWAYSSRRKQDFDEAARLPFTGDHVSPEGEQRRQSDTSGDRS